MSTTADVTADELLALPTGMGKRYELVTGELRVMSPAGWRHGKIAIRFGAKLAAHVDEHNLGIVFGAETGFRLASKPDTVRAPDVSFVAKEHIPADEPSGGFWAAAPDPAVEVLSPDDGTGEVDEKIDAWLRAGLCRRLDRQSKTQYGDRRFVGDRRPCEGDWRRAAE
ncbi:MAG TPA: Uma2 family endonuclease [Lacipirellulaceae bacterium]|nr:Uma2 family endonuclease [Lacipirellulaceae bacterium]